MEQFISRYRKLGVDFDPSEVVVKPSLRVNTLKIADAALLKRLKKQGVKFTKIPYLEHGYFYESSFSLGATPEYLLGYYYLQSASSQFAAELLSPKKNDLVLDMASAPGGKTTHLAQLMNNKGVVVALDVDTRRLDSLRNNVERLGVTNVVSYKKDGRFVSDFGLQFDKILLDAPCSGNFTLEADWFKKRSLLDLKEMSKLQRELLKEAWKVLKPKGTLAYSTCSLEPEEDELNLDWFLEKFSDAKLVSLPKSVGSPALTEMFGKKLNPDIKKAMRFWPHKDSVNGFFVAKIEKK